jgi:uncharacterized membrane protein YhiD involved in acid resistance
LDLYVTPSSLAGIVTACGTLFTALALVITAVTGLMRSRKVEQKVDAGNAQGVETHKLVNQRFTDLEKYVIALQRQIRADGGTPVEDQSKGEDQAA